MKYTRTERAIWIKQWQESGLSKADFCRQHALDLKRFYSWFGQRSDPLADKTHFSKVIYIIRIQKRIGLNRLRYIVLMALV